MNIISSPKPFLEIRFNDTSRIPSLVTLCAGYESGKWRGDQLAEHLVEWIPEFCLKYSEIKGLGSGNAVRLIKQAAANIYTTKKFENRGEIGEMILHAAIRQEFNTIPMVSKIYYKDSPNDTVKGFDCVHVVDNEEELELWLGEAKFYDDFKRAARDVAKELEIHIQNDYLRKEFVAIFNKLDEQHPLSKRISTLLDKNTSLDKIFLKMVIPILITYDSRSIKSYTCLTEEFKQNLDAEMELNYKYFISKFPTISPTVHLIAVPLEQKDILVAAFDKELGRLR